MLNIPRWAQEGGQMHDDPRVSHMRFVTEQAKAYAPDLDEALFFADLLCDDVQYVRPTDQQERSNPNFAPIEVAAEWEVISEATEEAERWEDHPRTDQPAYRNPFEEERIGDFDDDDHWDYDPGFDIVREGETPNLDWKDGQRSKMVKDAAFAAAKGKAWGKNPAFLLGALSGLDAGMEFRAARERGFTFYHACRPDNVKIDGDTVTVACADFSTGKRKTVYRNITLDEFLLIMQEVGPTLSANDCLKFARIFYRAKLTFQALLISMVGAVSAAF